MRSTFFRSWVTASALWAAVCSLGNSLKAMQADDKALEQEIAFVLNEQSDEAEPHEAPKYWLGITLKPVEGDLATYLKSSDGVLVDSVFPDSPASAAGLEKGDILVSIGDTKLIDPKSLLSQMLAVKADDEGKLPALKVLVLRKGESKPLELTPVVRPHEVVNVEATFTVDDDDKTEPGKKESLEFTFDLNDKTPEEIEKMVEKLQDANGSGLRIFRFGTPARVAKHDAEPKSKTRMVLRESIDGQQVEISVHRDGDGPAEITIKSDGEAKQYTSDQLDKMPVKVRKAVEELLDKKAHLKLEAQANAAEEENQAKKKVAQARNRIAIISADGKNIELAEHMNKELAEKYRAMAEEIAGRAHKTAQQTAKWAHEAASMPNEIKELQAEVAKMRAQIQELSEQLKSK